VRTRAFYPGSFDPWHVGHQSVFETAVRLFGEGNVIVGVGVNPLKTPWMSAERRVELIRKATGQSQVTYFSNYAVSTAREHGCQFMVRGVRGVDDVGAESMLMEMNAHIQTSHGAPLIEPIWIPKLMGISSSAIRQLVAVDGDEWESVVMDYFPESIRLLVLQHILEWRGFHSLHGGIS